MGGCARGFYRRQADREAYGLIRDKADRVQASTDEWGLDRGPDSRLYDPDNKDHPPRPEDDPVSAEYMHAYQRHPKLTQAQEETWRRYLPGSGRGEIVIQLHDAVEVALRNSHDYQSAREELYISALDLSEEKYRLHPHLGLGSNGARQLGPTATVHTTTLAGLKTTGSADWLLASGAQIITSAANTIIWDFDRPNLRTATSLLNFSIVQPLMRFGGRARTLEPLTQSERHLLANVRRMEQYQQGFYLNIVAGRAASTRPARSVASLSTAPSIFAGSPSGVGGVPGAAGFLGLLQDQQAIHNLESNVAGLRSSLAQLEAAFDAGRAASLLQVLQARQALQTAQSNLLTSRAAYQTRLDTFKGELGLPPSLPVELRDKMLSRFTIFDPATTELQNNVTDLAIALQDADHLTTPAALEAKIKALQQLRPHFESSFAAARRDAAAFRAALPARTEQFKRLRARRDVQELELQATRFDPDTLGKKVTDGDGNLDTLQASVNESFDNLETIRAGLATADVHTARAAASGIASNLTGDILRLSLDRAGSRIETVTLPPADLNEARAMEIARANRLDWMNARSELVDAWRKIDYNANPLMSGLDLKLDADLGTTNPTGHNSSTHFDTRNGKVTGALQFDTPLDRLRERNTYREALIDYQRARRQYIDFEDNVSQSLRNTLRLVNLSQLNFEFRRSAVQTALAQVDLARLKLDEPPRPGQAATLGVTAARDLVSALSDLLDAQNAFLAIWVGSEVLRMELDYELGLMEIDHSGHWVEPGPFTGEVLAKRLARRASADRLASTSVATTPKVVE
jgi:outer membrane protein TolC